ncbi:hypothetical protein [Clostridium transplantifaecale]|uniref:hypothetical protein n=1 Tax=Clostridium transplantifaecale TaxID=2479838 RepID=UPI000F635DA3|nr:hypothetical protein [Clostridium transplantifaecale]
MGIVDRSADLVKSYRKGNHDLYYMEAGQVNRSPSISSSSGKIGALGNLKTESGREDKLPAQILRRNRDIAELSPDRDTSVSDTAISDLFDILSKDYPGITFLAEKQSGTHNIRQMAAELGRGTYLVVSREFLERMARSREDYDACRTALAEALRQLSAGGKDMEARGIYLSESKAVSWYIPEQSETDAAKKMADALKKNMANSSGGPESWAQKPEENDFSKRVHVSYSSMNHFSSLARAGSKGEVKKVMSDVHRSINNLRLAAVYGDEKERVKAGRAMRSLKKLLARGSKKIRKLDQEELLGVRKKHAEKARKEKRVRQIKLELKKRRSARKGADYSLIREGLSDQYMILGDRHSRKDYESKFPGENVDFYGGFTDIRAGMSVGMEFTASEVIISGETVF